MLELLADRARNSEIARHLGMTGKTVRDHVSAILMKLQGPGRTAAAIKAPDRQSWAIHRGKRPRCRTLRDYE